MRFAHVGSCVIRGSFLISVPRGPDGDRFLWSEREGIHGPYVGYSVPSGRAVVAPRWASGSSAFCHPIFGSMLPFATAVVGAKGDMVESRPGRHGYEFSAVVYDSHSAAAILTDSEILAEDAPRPSWWPDMSDEELELLVSVIGS